MSSLEEEKVESLKSPTQEYRSYTDYAEAVLGLTYQDARKLDMILRVIHQEFGRTSEEGKKVLQRYLCADPAKTLLRDVEFWATWDGSKNPKLIVDDPDWTPTCSYCELVDFWLY